MQLVAWRHRCRKLSHTNVHAWQIADVRPIEAGSAVLTSATEPKRTWGVLPRKGGFIGRYGCSLVTGGRMLGHGYTFRSSLFEIDRDEDEETNPRRYGRALARWLALRLADSGYLGATVIPEDWGWCVALPSDSFRIWVGCGNMDESDASPDSPPPAPADVTWHCFPAVDISLLARVLRRSSDAEAALRRLDSHLRGVLLQEQGIALIEARVDR